jgi:hypothetical protein
MHFHLSFSESNVEREDRPSRRIVEAWHASRMISPTPGIRRPSYNGAPAMPTFVHFQTAKAIILRAPGSLLNSPYDFLPLVVANLRRPNARGRIFPHRSRRLNYSDE